MPSALPPFERKSRQDTLRIALKCHPCFPRRREKKRAHNLRNGSPIGKTPLSPPTPSPEEKREREKRYGSCVSDARLRPLSRRALTGGHVHSYPVKGKVLVVCVKITPNFSFAFDPFPRVRRGRGDTVTGIFLRAKKRSGGGEGA